MGSPFLYFAGDRLSPAELSAARLDGHVVELGDAYIPADAVETTALRAGSLRGILGDTLAATHLTAAWIHGALHEPPARHTIQRAVSRRVSHLPGGVRFVYRDLAVDPGDLSELGGVRVTTPVRTLADLSRVPEDAYLQAARRLAAEVEGLVDQAVAWLDARGPLPHKKAARAVLLSCAAGVRTT